MQDPVLVLNATFEPINVTAVRRAMVLMIKGVAQAEENPSHSGALRFAGAAGTFGHSPAGLSPYPAADSSPITEEHPAARP